MRTALRVLAWNVGLLALFLVIVELIFGSWLEMFTKPGLWRLSIYRDVDWHLSAVGMYDRPDPVHYRRDTFALRGNYGRPEDVEVLVLGGSTTDERFVSEGETWTDVLRSCLTARNRTAVIANAGVAGQSSRGHILNFEQWLNHIPGLRPRYILVYLGINENALAGRVAEDDVRIYNETGRPIWLERLRLKSAVYALVTAIRGNIRAWQANLHSLSASRSNDMTLAEKVDQKWKSQREQMILRGSAAEAALLEESTRQHSHELSSYSRRLTDLIATIRKFGAEPVLITQTKSDYRLDDDGQIRGDLYQYAVLTGINAVTLAACREEKLTCINAPATIRVQDGDFWDSVHTTPQGSRRVGEAICSEVVERKILSSLKSQ